MVEEMYLEDLKEHEGGRGSAANLDENDINLQNQNHSINNEDRKPTHDQLVRIDSECLSSIINVNPEQNNDGKKNKSAVVLNEFDFSSYNHYPAEDGGATVSYLNENGGGHNYGGGVSLTLGLHQQDEYYSLLDSDNQSQTNLPLRNLLGAQLLHDLAG
ncbi:hypothetical protein BUALT_Bualt05G0052200 [Buddleja alternifolia]|uniref:Uncharacterized protein n=1 Tax=Buddleja alternifolia TaxID=168488 RepID=A0AAV6XQA4_9LAMI|nr:hypothetical protein BUALT_Bualt05G0052200 [Buddleja alternifolia]